MKAFAGLIQRFSGIDTGRDTSAHKESYGKKTQEEKNLHNFRHFKHRKRQDKVLSYAF